MKKNRDKYLLWMLLLVAWTAADGQALHIVASAGQQLTGSNGQVSYTVGEPAITTLSSAGNIVTQGYQQSKMYATGINQIAPAEYTVSVYPNPVNDQLTIYIQGLDQLASFRLYDAMGKLLYETSTLDEKTQMDFSRFAAGQYLLELTDQNGKIFNTQKIIKTN